MLKVSLNSLLGGTKSFREKYKKAMKLLEKAVNSEEFKQRVLNFNYNDNGVIINNFKGAYHHETGKLMSNQEVYDLIMSGYDIYTKEKDGDIDIESTLYSKRWSSAMGFTYPSTIRTWMNTYIVQEIPTIAGNQGHESLGHNLGFTHSYKWNPTRQFSQPYAIGYIIASIVESYLEPVSYGNGINTYVNRSIWSRLKDWIIFWK